MHQEIDYFHCKYCLQLVSLEYREFFLLTQSPTTMYYESCCMACARERGLAIVTDEATKEVLWELSFIVGHDAIRLAAPTSLGDSESDEAQQELIDSYTPNRRKTDRKNDEQKFYRGIMREIRKLRQSEVEEPITPSQTLSYRCKSNQESEYKFPIRSNWKPSEVPNSIEAYRKHRLEQLEEWAKYKLNPDGTFSKDNEEK